MGMFDYYVLQEDYRCPKCGQLLTEFQGKDSENALFVWKEGNEYPIDQRVVPESKISKEALRKESLPSSFRIYDFCKNRHETILDCEKLENNYWIKTLYNKA